MLPSFLVIGASKCGTTSVCDILSQHPEVFVTDPKEPHFFVFDEFEEWLPWYEKLFDGAKGCRAAGEGSVSYTLPHNAELAAERIKRWAPNCRLVYMVRHPVRRLESDWKMRTIEGQRPGPLERAVHDHPDLVTIGAYWRQLSVYRRYFSDEQIHVCFLEDLVERPDRELIRILKHIGVNPDLVPSSAGERRNSAEARRRQVAVRRLGPLYSIGRRLKGVLPTAVTNAVIDSLARRAPDPKVVWDEETHEHVVAELAVDTRLFLSHCGKPEDFWDLRVAPRS